MRSATGRRSSFGKGLPIAWRDAAFVTPAGSPMRGREYIAVHRKRDAEPCVDARRRDKTTMNRYPFALLMQVNDPLCRASNECQSFEIDNVDLLAVSFDQFVFVKLRKHAAYRFELHPEITAHFFARHPQIEFGRGVAK